MREEKPDLDGGWKNAAKFGDELSKVWAAFVVSTWRLFRVRDSHSYVNVFVEMAKASGWFWGHLWALGIPVLFLWALWEWAFR